MKYAILALFFAVNAKAGIPPASQPGGGGSDCTTDCTFDSVDASSITVDINLIKTVDRKVGIGTAAPGVKLEVSSGAIRAMGTGAQLMVGPTHSAPGGDWNANAANTLLVSNAGSSADNAKGYQIQSYYNGAVAADQGGSIGFGATFTPGTLLAYAGIKGLRSNATDSNADGYLSFLTRTNGVAMAERMRIDKDGKVSLVTGALVPYSRTTTQLLAITPAATGEMYFCNNCSPLKMVISTGTSAGNFASIDGGSFE